MKMETARRGDRSRLKGAKWHFLSGPGDLRTPRQEISRLPSKGRSTKPMQNEESKLRYQAYLLSDYWQKVSDAVKAKAGYKCQICNSPHDLQAHHRSYEHRGRELEFIEDLTCLCRRCHGIFHGKTVEETKLAPAPSGPPQPEKVEMVWITAQNCKRLRCAKQQWHWMKDNGINPQKKGWAKRAIGWEVPKSWLR